MRVLDGHRVVTASFAFLVVLGGAFGYVLGAVILPQRLNGPIPPATLGPLTFAITPYSLAAYGVAMVAVGLGGLVLAVRYASVRYDDVESV